MINEDLMQYVPSIFEQGVGERSSWGQCFRRREETVSETKRRSGGFRSLTVQPEIRQLDDQLVRPIQTLPSSHQRFGQEAVFA